MQLFDIVADNGVMAAYFLILIALSSITFMRKIFPESARSRAFCEAGPGQNESLWAPKPISLLDIASSIAIALIIAAASVKISAYFSNPDFPGPVRAILGQKYLLLTTLAILFPLVFPRLSKKVNGSEELGVFFIFVFFALIGVPASIKTVILEAPRMLLFCAIILAVNLMCTIGLGKLFKFELEELVLAAVVTSGGPMNGAAIATSKGWHALVVPSLLIGIWGYIIGNYTGYLMGIILGKMF